MVYADWNATTPLVECARSAMTRAFERWGNPSSSHQVGRESLELLEQCRRQIAKTLGCTTQEVVFTSGGSEANTSVLLGASLKAGQTFRLLTTRVEHSSVLGIVKVLQDIGNIVKFVEIDSLGRIDLALFEAEVRDFKPHLVSVMTANNETGVVFPIPQIVGVCRSYGVSFHTDAVQALGKVEPSFFGGSDFISVSAHKIGGPKGVGALVVKKPSVLIATHYGGSQELKRRGGTQNMVGICGFSGACESLLGKGECERLLGLRNGFEKAMLQVEGVHVVGQGVERLPNTTNLRIKGIQSEILLSALDLKGIWVSAGSACSSGSISPSHVLLAMGLSPVEARECLRVSWGRDSTEDDVAHMKLALIDEIHRIRERRSSK